MRLSVLKLLQSVVLLRGGYTRGPLEISSSEVAAEGNSPSRKALRTPQTCTQALWPGQSRGPRTRDCADATAVAVRDCFDALHILDLTPRPSWKIFTGLIYLILALWTDLRRLVGREGRDIYL